jgi:hypothetical protein
LISANLNKFTLSVGGREVELTYDKLEPSDAAILKTAYLDEQDFMQFERVKDKLPSIQERSKSVADLLIQIQRDIPDSPYAGLWAVVALSAGMNEHVKAEKWANTTIKCIETQRAVSASRHETTLASAYNNLAILQLKAKKGDMAGGAFLHALDSREVIPFVINHNAQQLLEITDEDKTIIKLSDRTRRALNKKIAVLQAAAPGSVAADGWHYSLDFDVPSGSVAAQKVEGVDPPIPGMELSAMGTGFVVAPGVVLTTSSLIKDIDGIQRKLMTVTARDSGGILKSYRVQSVHTPEIIGRASSVSSVSIGDARNAITFTTFDVIHPKAGTAEAEICALHVPGLPTPPAVFAPTNATKDAEITVFGFHRGGDAVERGVQKWDGSVVRVTDDARAKKGIKGSQGMSVAVEGGARGGPVVQADGSVVGMAFGSVEDDPSVGVLFPVTTIRRWFGEFVKTSDLTYVKTDMPIDDIASRAENATIPVFAWGLPEASDTKVFSKFVDASQIGGMALIDNWCIACDGDGHMRCPNPECRKGALIGKKTVRDGVNPVTGQALYTEETTATPCGVCRGKGFVDCPHCEAGQLRTGSTSRSRR